MAYATWSATCPKCRAVHPGSTWTCGNCSAPAHLRYVVHSPHDGRNYSDCRVLCSRGCGWWVPTVRCPADGASIGENFLAFNTFASRWRAGWVLGSAVGAAMYASGVVRHPAGLGAVVIATCVVGESLVRRVTPVRRWYSARRIG